MVNSVIICEILNDIQMRQSYKVIKESFKDVANEFELTEDNCPSNAAFITLDKIYEFKRDKIKMFGIYDDNMQIGFVVLKKSCYDGVYYLEKLCIIKKYRNKGYGKVLLNFSLDYVSNFNVKKISIGIINENKVLKNWYKKRGFKEVSIKDFNHLPFTVCFMEYEL
ncbi:MAG: GNAT family N-acetyltransferase [Clostridiales bacterium]